MTKTVLALGCSQSSGAELSDGLKEDYWHDILKMDDPWREWFHHSQARKKHDLFMKTYVGGKEDWTYNRTNAWPYRLHEMTGDSVWSAANPGTGVSYVKWLYNKEHYNFSGHEPDLFKTTQGLIEKWNGKQIQPSDAQGFFYGNVYKEVNRFEIQESYGYHAEDKIINKKMRDDISIREKNNTPQGSHIFLYDTKLGNRTTWFPKKGESFKKLVDNVDHLIWQIPSDEPRFLITHPNIPWAYWIPKIHQTYRERKGETYNSIKESMMSCVHTCLKHNNLITDKERETISKTWEREADKNIEYYANSYDWNNLMIDNANFITSIVLKRKQKGLRTTLFWMEDRCLDMWDGLLDFDYLDYFTCSNILKLGTTPKDIKRRLREGSFPFQKFGHISKWSNKQIVNRIMETYND